MDNGGLRPEYDKYNKKPDTIFVKSLRSQPKANLKYFRDQNDKADITTYLNWQSRQAKAVMKKHARMQKDLTERLTSRSPRSPRR